MVELVNGWQLNYRQEEVYNKAIKAYLKDEKEFFNSSKLYLIK